MIDAMIVQSVIDVVFTNAESIAAGFAVAICVIALWIKD